MLNSIHQAAPLIAFCMRSVYVEQEGRIQLGVNIPEPSIEDIFHRFGFGGAPQVAIPQIWLKEECIFRG